jgi:hypothetical protein
MLYVSLVHSGETNRKVIYSHSLSQLIEQNDFRPKDGGWYYRCYLTRGPVVRNKDDFFGRKDPKI